jgi:hypothetical protein
MGLILFRFTFEKIITWSSDDLSGTASFTLKVDGPSYHCPLAICSSILLLTGLVLRVFCLSNHPTMLKTLLAMGHV